MEGKPTVDELGIDPDAQSWQRSGTEQGGIEGGVRAGQRPGLGVAAGRW